MKKILITASVVILVAIVVGVAVFLHMGRGGNTLPPQYHPSATINSPAAPHFDHVVVILEENKPKTKIIGNNDAPFINKLASTYAQGVNYYAVTHPSLPNYIALTSGTTAGITNDCNPPSSRCQANVQNVADRLEHASKSWKEYAESMPHPCYASNDGDYAVRHNPFLYYPDIRNNAARCQAHDVPLGQLSADLKTTSGLPDYAFITPNLCSDMHNCSIKTGDDWLANEVPKILNSPAFTQQHSLLVVTWDEGDSGSNNVPVIFAGPAAKKGYKSTTYYSHYSLLRTIENNWQLDSLTQNDKLAPTMNDMLQ